MKIIRSLALPLSVLTLTFTQLSSWQFYKFQNKCISAWAAKIGDNQMAIPIAVGICNGKADSPS